MKEITVFDICGTLYESNTTFDFYRFYFKATNSRKLRSFERNFSLPFKMLYKLMFFLNADYYIRKKLIHYIAGEPVKIVQQVAQIFVKEYLNDKKINFTQKILREKSNRDLILISASIEPVVESIANDLSISLYLSTLLEIKNGVYTGKIKKEIQGNKLAEFEKLIGNRAKTKVTFFTDNKEDLPLALKAQEVYILSSKRNKKFWLKSLDTHSNLTIIDKNR